MASTFRPFLALLLSAIATAPPPASAYQSAFDVRPGTGQSVSAFQTYGSVGNRALSVVSPVPVTVLRYRDDADLEGTSAVLPGEARVGVKSAGCAEGEGGGIDWAGGIFEYDEDGGEDGGPSVSVGGAVPPGAVPGGGGGGGGGPSDAGGDPSFLPASSFGARWSYTSFWCGEDIGGGDAGGGEGEGENGGGDGKGGDAGEDKTRGDDGGGDAGGAEGEGENGGGGDGKGGDAGEDKTRGGDGGGDGAGDDGASGAPLLRLSWVWTAAAGLVFIFFPIIAGPGGAVGMRRAGLGALVAVAVAAAVGLGGDGSANGEEGRPLPRELAEEAGSSQQCQAVAEVLVDGCSQTLIISAPAVRVLDAVLVNYTESTDESDKCTTNYEAIITFPEPLHPISLDEEEVEGGRKIFTLQPLEDLSSSPCVPEAVEGRPFLDAEGRHLRADVIESEVRLWSAPNELQSKGSQSPVGTLLVTDDEKTNHGSDQDWTRRALGEHASIASFAAFTLDLLSNGAPPDLVRDALYAALDEVRHAEVSFEVASTLAGGHSVEPGPIPPTTRSFKQDLTALALGAAMEGCIDETLSALALAAEAEAKASAKVAALQKKIITISMEEAKHSALAWRTVQWVCGIDEAACEAVLGEAFDPKQLVAAPRKHSLYSDKIEKAWEMIHKALVPFVTMREEESTEHLQIACSGSEDINEMHHNMKQTDSVIQSVAWEIVTDVYCGPGKV